MNELNTDGKVKNLTDELLQDVEEVLTKIISDLDQKKRL